MRAKSGTQRHRGRNVTEPGLQLGALGSQLAGQNAEVFQGGLPGVSQATGNVRGLSSPGQHLLKHAPGQKQSCYFPKGFLCPGTVKVECSLCLTGSPYPCEEGLWEIHSTSHGPHHRPVSQGHAGSGTRGWLIPRPVGQFSLFSSFLVLFVLFCSHLRFPSLWPTVIVILAGQNAPRKRRHIRTARPLPSPSLCAHSQLILSLPAFPLTPPSCASTGVPRPGRAAP